MQLAITTYSINSILDTLFRSQAVKINIPTNILIGELGENITTESFAELIPSMFNKFGKKPLAFSVNPMKEPNAVVTEDGSFNLTIPALVSFYVELNEAETALAFEAITDLQIELFLHVN